MGLCILLFANLLLSGVRDCELKDKKKRRRKNIEVISRVGGTCGSTGSPKKMLDAILKPGSSRIMRLCTRLFFFFFSESVISQRQRHSPTKLGKSPSFMKFYES